MALVSSTAILPPITFVCSFPSSHQASCTHTTGMQMPLAQGMERREPPSECVAGGMETHPAAGRLISVDSLSSLLFQLVLEAKPPCDCAPRVWEHGNHW